MVQNSDKSPGEGLAVTVAHEQPVRLDSSTDGGEKQEDPQERGGDSLRRPGHPAAKAVGHAPASLQTCSIEPHRNPSFFENSQLFIEHEDLLAGHFHVEDTAKGLRFTNCEDRHNTRNDGRSIIACEEGLWGFAYWLKTAMPGKRGGRVPAFTLSSVKGKLLPFRCKSWRHIGECRDFVFKRDFKRIMDALESRPVWLFVVLTLSRKRWKAGPRAAYKNFWRAWQRLRQRLGRLLGEKIEFICVMEQHRDGWPHMNLLLYWKGMENVDDLPKYAEAIGKWLKRKAPSCGIGHSVFCQELESQKNIAGYFSGQSLGYEGNGPRNGNQISKAHRQVAGEVNKQSKSYQVPTDAPLGFRRIRSSRHLVTPVGNDESEFSGAIWNPEKQPKDSAIPAKSIKITRGKLFVVQGKPDTLELPGARDEGGPARNASGGAEAKRRPVRGVWGAEPPTSGRLRRSAARRRIEHLTGMPDGFAPVASLQEWWAVSKIARQGLETIGLSAASIRLRIARLKESFERGRKYD